MEIRPEQPSDIATIRQITKAAFAPMEYGSQTEAEIIDALRKANALKISLVAVDGGAVIGHVAFSPVTIDGGDYGWYGLGPVSVYERFGFENDVNLIFEGVPAEYFMRLRFDGPLAVGKVCYHDAFNAT